MKEMVPKSVSVPLKGIYCLCNDNALEWFEAFIRSVREHNPNISLTVIPYNCNITKIEALREKHPFSVMSEAIACKFDAIASRVAGRGISGNTFRKFACFLGEYEQFLFLDSDIVVTMEIGELFEAFENSQYDLVYFDYDMQVFTPDFAKEMIREYDQFGFNSGAFFARKAALDEKAIKEAALKGESIQNSFGCWGEQPFLNYVCQTSRLCMTHVNKLNPNLSFKPKAWSPFYFDNKTDRFLDPEQGILPLVHWAGQEWPTMTQPEPFLKYRTLGMGVAEKRKYVLNFYYRRFRASLKERMKQSPLFANWIKKRDERLCRKPMKLKTKAE